MSVILTAGKKSIMSKPKSAKKKKGKRPAPAFPAGPPVSTEQTTVWHFTLYGVECTVMFNKLDLTVWCNGEDLETVDGFSENGMDGSVIDFYITLEDNSCHRGRIQCVRDAKSLSHQLIVDGCTIQERTHASQCVQQIPCQSQEPQITQAYDQSAYPSAYSNYNHEGAYDGGYAPQQQQQGNSSGGYNHVENGAYGGYNGLPPAAVYEPPPQYDDVVRQNP